MATVSRKGLTKRRTPAPAKITFAGENTCDKYHKYYMSLFIEIYQADALSKRRRKGVEDVDGRIEPLGQPLIDTSRLFKLLHLVLKDGENGGRRVAAVQSGGKWMREKVFFSLFLIRSQGSVEDGSKVGKGSGRTRGSRHGAIDEELIHGKMTMGRLEIKSFVRMCTASLMN